MADRDRSRRSFAAAALAAGVAAIASLGAALGVGGTPDLALIGPPTAVHADVAVFGGAPGGAVREDPRGHPPAPQPPKEMDRDG